jgi:RHS repeat-associated protein
VVSRHEYLPCGWELYSGLTGRTTGHGYLTLTSPEGVPTPTQRFTGKERDTVETGLDYFGARYFSGAMGRFTGPDPQEFNKRTISNPQKWNRYAYVLNNPLALIDPDGKEEIRVTIRAFIPESNFRYPAGIGPMWKGDGRSFSAGASASSRAQVTFTIETDPSKSVRPLVSDPTFKTSGSAVNVYGLFTATANSDVTGTVGTNTRMSDGTSVVSLSMTASDPLIPGAPPTGGKPALEGNLERHPLEGNPHWRETRDRLRF